MVLGGCCEGNKCNNALGIQKLSNHQFGTRTGVLGRRPEAGEDGYAQTSLIGQLVDSVLEGDVEGPELGLSHIRQQGGLGSGRVPPAEAFQQVRLEVRATGRSTCRMDQMKSCDNL